MTFDIDNIQRRWVNRDRYGKRQIQRQFLSTSVPKNVAKKKEIKRKERRKGGIKWMIKCTYIILRDT